MNKNKRTLAGFGEVAKITDNKHDSADIGEVLDTANVNESTDAVTDVPQVSNVGSNEISIIERIEDDQLDSIKEIVSMVEQKKEKGPTKKQVVVHLSEDVANELQERLKKYGKGYKSQIVDALLRKAFGL